MSNHSVEVVPVSLRPHPNADSLSIVDVYGFQVVVRSADWEGISCGAYIPPDSVVPETDQFAWLGPRKRDRRIRVKRLRGELSMGLLVPAPDGTQVGDDVADILGVIHYEPPIQLNQNGQYNRMTGGEAETPPPSYNPRYDVENMRRYTHLFKPGEMVFVTEKIHGANARFTFEEDRFWCGSRTEWKRESDTNVWWKVLKQYPELQAMLKKFPTVTVYGEIYGSVQSLRYGCKPGEVRLAVFDVWSKDSGEWWTAVDGREAVEMFNIPQVPFITVTPFDFDYLQTLAEGDSLIPGANHLREGVVVKPLVERNNPEIGRVQLKLVSNKFLEKDQ